MLSQSVENPFRPGAGHRPPYLAGREYEQGQFRRLLEQRIVTENVLVTGLRGVGKTVLLDIFKTTALEQGWLWVGNDLSESSGLSEERLSVRILTDLAAALADPAGPARSRTVMGFVPPAEAPPPPTYETLCSTYLNSPGLPSDKLRAAMDLVAEHLKTSGLRGIVLAYDEAQCLSDHAERHEYPLSMLLETCQHLQRRYQDQSFMLVLTGLPALLDALTESRTYTERMFHVLVLDRLSRRDTLAAIKQPLEHIEPRLDVPDIAIDRIADLAGGYPYLIQFFCKELIDSLANGNLYESIVEFPSEDAWRRLDNGLFAARWNRTTDKQREVLRILAGLPDEQGDFSAQEIADASSEAGAASLTNAQAHQLLQGLVERGLVYRTRRGKYAFSLPMSQMMIRRRIQAESEMSSDWGERAPSWTRMPAGASLRPAQPPPPSLSARLAGADLNPGMAEASVPGGMGGDLITAFREVMRSAPYRPRAGDSAAFGGAQINLVQPPPPRAADPQRTRAKPWWSFDILRP